MFFRTCAIKAADVSGHISWARRADQPAQSGDRSLFNGYVFGVILPTVGEFVPGLEVTDWYGIGVPKKTPTEIVEKLNKEINAALADPKLKARFADLGGTVFPTSPAEFGKFIAAETEKWAKVIRAANIKPE